MISHDDFLTRFIRDEAHREHATSLMRFYQSSLTNPFGFWSDAINMGFEITKAAMGQGTVEPDRSDRRFKDPLWDSNPGYAALKHAYLKWCSELNDWLDTVSLEEHDRERARILLNTIADSVSPTNTILGNPTAMKTTLESGGKNLVDGFKNMVHDLVNNNGMPSMVDKSAFEVGGNLGVTPGKVVLREPHLELIQYAPQTAEVHATPIFLVPPQINKFYVWDLAPGRSVVEFLLQQGFQVFVVSWFNPTPEQADWDFDSYIQALDNATTAACEIAKTDKLHMVGACSGGITTATLLGYWASRGSARKASLTLVVTVLDTDGAANTSMGLMTSLEGLELAKFASKQKGVLEGKELAKIFAWLRPNDLIWNYWVSNYLLGKQPPAFDILYWNADSTNLPAGLHADFIDILEENALTQADVLSVLDTPIDLKKVTCDTLVVGGTTDHITPWEGGYRTLDLVGGKSEFVLSNSGHIQAVVNPPTNKKGSYLLNPGEHHSPEEFLDGAEQHAGTWWLYWSDWLKARTEGTKKKPAKLGSKAYPPLCDAPGEYVRQ